jgi:hypothetical protein
VRCSTPVKKCRILEDLFGRLSVRHQHELAYRPKPGRMGTVQVSYDRSYSLTRALFPPGAVSSTARRGGRRQ